MNKPLPASALRLAPATALRRVAQVAASESAAANAPSLTPPFGTLAPPAEGRPRRWRVPPLVVFFVLVGLLIGTAWLSDVGVRDFRRQSQRVSRSLELIAQVERVEATMHRLKYLQAAYLVAYDRGALAAMLSQRPRLWDEVIELQRLAGESREQLDDANAVHDATAHWLDAIAHDVERFGAQAALGPPPLARPALLDPTQARVAELLTGMRRREAVTYRDRLATADGGGSRMRAYASAALGLTLAMLAGSFWSTGREHKRRARAERELKISLADAKGLTDKLRQLSEFGELLQSCRSFEEAMAVCRSATPGLLIDIAGTLYLLDPQRNVLRVACSFGRHRIGSRQEFAPDDCWAVRRNQNFPSSEGSHGVCCDHLQVPAGAQPAYVCIPLAAQGETLGVLYLDAPRELTRAERRLARAVAEQLSLALSNLQLQESLRTQSIRDPLTGLFNRRYLEESLEREIARAGRHNAHLSLLMLDVDHFKRTNDTHGHEGGDAVLTALGALLRDQSRREDIACRYGGEEFVLILPDTTVETARVRAEQLLEAVRAMHVKLQGRDLDPTTVSVGVSGFPVHGRQSDALRNAADMALYRAKHGGRNRVEVAQD